MSKLNRRQATRILIGSMLAAPSIVKADTNRPIFLVVPYGAGGVVDAGGLLGSRQLGHASGSPGAYRNALCSS